jgi:2-polyprenyl-6-methoxyphenol hydroxylase-like FAD-dependent oxidoreductase
MMRAVVVGAGIAGLTVADQLARGGWDVTVVERSPTPRGQGYMIDFFGPGFDTAERIGLLARLRARAYDIDTVSWIDENGRVRARLRYDKLRRAVDGRLFSLLRPDIEDALSEALPTSVDVRFGSAFTGFHDAGQEVVARMEDSSEYRCDVLIGADGIHSGVRRALFGDDGDHLVHLGYHTCAFTVVDPALHERWASTFAMTDTLEKTVGMYGPRGDRVAMFGVHRVGDPALPADPRADLLRRYAGLGSDVDAVLAKCPGLDEIYYDQVAQVVLPAWSSGRVVLVGDACGAVSLLAGQGASLAIAGAAELARALITSGEHGVRNALTGYERTMRPVVEEKQAAGRRAADSFVPRSRFGLWVRRVSLRLLVVPGLDRLVARRLIGKPSDAFRS